MRCTKKLLTVIGQRQVADCPPDGEDWYANLLWLSGRKCLLLTHAATLFTVFEANVRTAGLRDPGGLATGLIHRELQREGLPAETFGSMIPASVMLAKTADRSVLGCMNDIAFMCETAAPPTGRRARYRHRRAQPLATAHHQQRPGLPAANRADRPAPSEPRIVAARRPHPSYLGL